MAAAMKNCRVCQRQLLESFVSFAGLSLVSPRPQALRRPARSLRSIKPTSEYRTRTFHSTSIRRDVQQESTAPESSSSPASSNSANPPSEAPSETSTDASIPWYLRVSTPTPLNPQTLPNPALQDIPPLPLDPPTILEPILTHLSLTIGLDALTILDLRGLTPPSALGANLIMILGTARSEKHLNTSADRFCRWIRNTYKLRPYADGLLGRNELKLKLRRRNKKIKLAQSVGNTMFDAERGYDDGITTGWICCNLGSVDGAVITDAEGTGQVMDTEGEEGVKDKSGTELHEVYSLKDQERPLDEEAEYSNPSEDDFTYRGFGDVSTAPKIVVQMFTEEKRAEMDLEGLWEARIKRRDARQEEQDRVFETSLLEREMETPGVSRVEGEQAPEEKYEVGFDKSNFAPIIKKSPR